MTRLGWHRLNAALRTASEEECVDLLAAELAETVRRPRHLKRIHARLRKLRRQRERVAFEQEIL